MIYLNIPERRSSRRRRTGGESILFPKHYYYTILSNPQTRTKYAFSEKRRRIFPLYRNRIVKLQCTMFSLAESLYATGISNRTSLWGNNSQEDQILPLTETDIPNL